jgi:hypothetical protein
MSLPYYMTHHYRSPHQVLGLPASSLNPQQIGALFSNMFESEKAGKNADLELQILCQAFVLLVTKFKVANATTHNATNTQVQTNTQSADKQEAMTQQVELERRAIAAETSATSSSSSYTVRSLNKTAIAQTR